MADGTKIEWTDASWNPIRARQLEGAQPHHHPGWHCEIISPGCKRCYAQAINIRLGTGLDYLRHGRGRVEVFLDERTLAQPLHWKRPRRVFVCSMSDLFGEWVPDEIIERIFTVMERCPQHIFQVLTKRAERMKAYLRRYTPMGASSVFPGRPGPLPNVWIGVSVEDQRRADERIPLLLQTPAAVRWISAEPIIGPVNLRRLAVSEPSEVGVYRTIDALTGKRGHMGPAGPTEAPDRPISKLSWCVIGGESGPASRPFNIEWGRSIIRQCAGAGVPVFMKQLGTHPYNWPGNQECALVEGNRIRLRNRKGGDPEEWPEDLRVREWPEKINA